ncbi:MAG: DegV family protein [Ruminococcaceae bacterium]|nr:DegV family protein [Oscillospiraceae bacterium]
MCAKIVIASDSTCDLSPELIEKYGVRILPLGVALGERQYTDGVDIDPDFIYDHYEKTGQLPKTSAVNLVDFEEFFAKNTADGSSLIFFTISSEMSSTWHNAHLAAETSERTFVVDTHNLSTGGGLLVIAAAEMAAEGMEAADIVAKCNELVPCVDASFIIDSLEFLYKGGRCSALAAFGANMLSLKPCIVVKDGKMGVGKKYRGKFGGVLPKYVSDRVGDGSDVISKHVFVTHAGCTQEIIDACVSEVRAVMPEAEIHVTRAGCTISSHCGRNTLGVLFIRTHALGE